FSKFMVSVGQWWLTGAWVLERLDIRKLQAFYLENHRTRFYLLIVFVFFRLLFEGIGRGFREFFRNKPAMIFSSIFILHIAGLIVTADFQYALKDLRTKVPLFILPIFLSTSETIRRKDFHRYMFLFVLALFTGTLFNTWKIINHEYIDLREVARHVGYIVYSLLVCVGIFISGYLVFKRGTLPISFKILLAIIMAWLVLYLFITKSFTGVAIIILTLLIMIPILVFKRKNRWLKIALLLLMVAMTGGVLFYIRAVVRDFYKVEPVDLTKLELNTSRGNLYEHNPMLKQTENGHYLWLYVQWDELRGSWNSRSRIRFDSNDLRGQPVKFTLIRFLTSKGERKDADAVQHLSPNDIHAIETGIANIWYMKKFSIRGRIYEFLMGYDNYRLTGNPTGSTVMQRVEFWKASIGLIRENWLYGVGTGDMNVAFRQQYDRMDTKLALDQRWRSHNQFMSICIAFGVFGLAWFLFATLYPAFATRRFDDYFFLTFLIITFTAMLTDDTIESQMGVTFFAFFYCFFLFGKREKDPV
ncbi:MAG: O-antigen ligase family protein, partial [bacterium]